MVARESKNVSIVEKFGCHKRAERLLRRTLGVRLRCMGPFLGTKQNIPRCLLFVHLRGANQTSVAIAYQSRVHAWAHRWLGRSLNSRCTVEGCGLISWHRCPS